MALTITDTTMTIYTPAADTGGEPAAALWDRLTPPPADRRPDGFEPRSGYVRFEPGPGDLEVSGDPKAARDDPPSHAAGTKARL